VPVDLSFTASAQQVFIEVKDLVQSAGGNDFVVDDIEITNVTTAKRLLKEDFEVFSNYDYVERTWLRGCAF
jgi:hypothetical protein